jgi:hypothetical protein
VVSTTYETVYVSRGEPHLAMFRDVQSYEDLSTDLG